MSKRSLWWLAKALEGVGMVIVLVGVFVSMNLGFAEESLESMAIEMKGLMIGGGMFLAGWMLERRLGAR